MIRQLLTLFLLLSFSVFYAQDNKVNRLIEEGIKLHDQGSYKEAIDCYNQALKLDAQNPVLNCETAYSYYALGDYKNSIKYAKKSIMYGNNKFPHPYVALGNSFDHTNNPEKAIKTYKKGLLYFPSSQQLHFNLALTLFNAGKYTESYNHAEQSLLINASHYNSNGIMNELMKISTNKVSAIFPKYFMLLLNNDNAEKQKVLLDELIGLMNESIERKDDKNVNIYLSPQDTANISIHSQLKMIVTLFGASLEDGIPENFNKFIDFNTMIFDVLVRWYDSEDRIKDTNIAFEKIYYPFFVNLHKAGHTEALTYYILDGSNVPGIKEWKEKNDQKLIKFIDWSNE